MRFLELFITALLPVLKLLLIVSVGSFLAMERFGILGKDARKHLNTTSSIYMSTYTYNLVRIYSRKSSNVNKVDDSSENPLSAPQSDPEDISKCSTGPSIVEGNESQNKNLVYQVAEKQKIRKHSKTFGEKLDLKAVIAPATIGTVLVGDRAPLRVVQDSASMVGDAAIPMMTLLVGANLLKGLKGSGVQLRSIVGIIVVRNIALPIVGIGIIKGVAHFGLIYHNPLYQFALLLQFALPPAVALRDSSKSLCEIFCSQYQDFDEQYNLNCSSTIEEKEDKMHFLELFITALLPVLKLLLIISVGSFLAMERLDTLGKGARKHLNTTGSIYLSTYTYNLVRIYSCKTSSNANKVDDSTENPLSAPKSELEDISKCSTGSPIVEGDERQNTDDDVYTMSDGKEKVAEKEKNRKHLRTFAEKLNLKAVITPSTIGTIIGLIIGITPPFRKVLVGDRAPLRVVQDSASMVGDAAIPVMTLLVGANLLKGLKGSGIQFKSIIGIIVVRNIALPIVGVGIIKGAAILA
ncbi:hypothetical protein L6164_025946 [Bauhinia variegata]|uniref:Uncharacterized protein n=1 Tax=Bauhinia variegata TaxID=167791 RepID=A0ACB9M5V1_BAUVA|nr:hypothetical protein L6164_025946 [Bauhinia variegata]